jgi:hypothetical protein
MPPLYHKKTIHNQLRVSLEGGLLSVTHQVAQFNLQRFGDSHQGIQ